MSELDDLKTQLRMALASRDAMADELAALRARAGMVQEAQAGVQHIAVAAQDRAERAEAERDALADELAGTKDALHDAVNRSDRAAMERDAAQAQVAALREARQAEHAGWEAACAADEKALAEHDAKVGDEATSRAYAACLKTIEGKSGYEPFAEALRARDAKVRAAALEEAACVAERAEVRNGRAAWLVAADDIRALKASVGSPAPRPSSRSRGR